MLIGILLKISLYTLALSTRAVHGDALDLFSLADAPVSEVTFIAPALAFISEDLLEAQCTQEDSGSDPVNQMTSRQDKSMGGFFFCCFCFPPFPPGRIPRHNNQLCLVSAKLMLLKVI